MDVRAYFTSPAITHKGKQNEDASSLTLPASAPIHRAKRALAGRHLFQRPDEAIGVARLVQEVPDNGAAIIDPADGRGGRPRHIDCMVGPIVIDEAVRVAGAVVIEADYLPGVVHAQRLREGRSRIVEQCYSGSTQAEPGRCARPRRLGKTHHQSLIVDPGGP